MKQERTLKQNIPEFITFNNPYVALVAASYAHALFGIEVNTNLQITEQAENSVFMESPFWTVAFRRSSTRGFYITWYSDKQRSAVVRSIKEFLDIISETDNIEVGQDHHRVTFGIGSICVGCQTIPNEVVRKIAARLKD